MSALLPTLVAQTTTEVAVTTPWWARVVVGFLMVALGLYLVLGRASKRTATGDADGMREHKADTSEHASHLRIAGFIVGGFGLYIVLKTMGLFTTTLM